MSNPAPQPDMAWHLRRLLEAVKEAACGLEGRWGWLAGPIALLARMWTRRERREAAEAMQAVQGMLEAFLTLVEEFRAGRLVECAKPEVDEPEPPAARAPTEEIADGRSAACALQAPCGNRSGRADLATRRIPAFGGVFDAISPSGDIVGHTILDSGFRRNDEENQRVPVTRDEVAIEDAAPLRFSPLALRNAIPLSPRRWRDTPRVRRTFPPTFWARPPPVFKNGVGEMRFGAR